MVCRLCKLFVVKGAPKWYDIPTKEKIFLRFEVLLLGRTISIQTLYRSNDMEMESILRHCHEKEVRGHFGGARTIAKVLQLGFYWPTLFKDSFWMIQECDQCQRMGNISKRDEMPLNNILVVELFDVWGINFMGPFPILLETRLS